MKYLKFLILLFFINCARPENKIANSVVSLDINSTAPFEHLGKIVGDKEIVILGESQHGDGKTLEMKSRLLKYLIKEKGFNTIAFEGRGFLDMEILNTSTPLDTLIKSFNKQALTSWYATEQQDQLNKAIVNNELNFIGLESYSYFVSREPDSFIHYLRKFLNEHYGYNEYKSWEQLKKINYNISFSKTDSITEKDIEFYAQSLSSMLDVIQNQSLNADINKLEKEIVLNSIKNAIIYSHLFKNRWLHENEINFSVYNNLRDEQMATNLFWHKERNPNAKIIIWTANFHGAKKIRDVIYKKEDPDLYKNYTLLGEHLHKEYGDQLYSIAFTSSRGETGMLNQEAKELKAPDGSLEKDIENKNIDYGFIDFSALRRSDPSFENEKFDAIILGHDNKPGKWINVFDGIFYIKENERVKSSS